MSAIDELERKCRSAQGRLDGRLSAGERNRLGRFATPTALAVDMLSLARGCFDGHAPVRLLDPALGTGVFYYAALKAFGPARVERAWGFEIDRQTAAESRRLWRAHGLAVRVGDFCGAAPPDREARKANLVACNPPYVRHHHLPGRRKRELGQRVRALGFEINGLAGLYAYFLLLADPWLCRGGVGVWIVPSELLDVNYGRALRGYLTRHVTLLRVHRFGPGEAPFPEALVGPVVLLFRKQPPPRDHAAVFSGGGSLSAPHPARRVPLARLDPAAKWGRLCVSGNAGGGGARRALAAPRALSVGDLLVARRGLATGANKFFVLKREEASRLKLPARFLRPILPGPRRIGREVISRGADGFPADLEALVVLDCHEPIGRIRRRFPGLYRYLERGRRQGIHLRYLPRNREPWYSQEHRPPAPILCTYMGRRRGGRFIRFLRNHSDATAANVYHLLYPRSWLRAAVARQPALLDRVFAGLREVEDAIEAAGRTYAGGLVKVEPRELEALRLPGWVAELVTGHPVGPVLQKRSNSH